MADFLTWVLALPAGFWKPSANVHKHWLLRLCSHETNSVTCNLVEKQDMKIERKQLIRYIFFANSARILQSWLARRWTCGDSSCWMLPALSNLFWRMFQGTSAFEKLHLRVPSSHMPIIKHTRIPKHKKAYCDGYISFFGGILEQQGGGNLRLIVSVASDLEVPTDRHFTSTLCTHSILQVSCRQHFFGKHFASRSCRDRASLQHELPHSCCWEPRPINTALVGFHPFPVDF